MTKILSSLKNVAALLFMFVVMIVGVGFASGTVDMKRIGHVVEVFRGELPAPEETPEAGEPALPEEVPLPELPGDLEGLPELPGVEEAPGAGTEGAEGTGEAETGAIEPAPEDEKKAGEGESGGTDEGLPDLLPLDDLPLPE